jgi:hypothetical protein
MITGEPLVPRGPLLARRGRTSSAGGAGAALFWSDVFSPLLASRPAKPASGGNSHRLSKTLD